MINILHIMGSADIGGMSAVVLNYYSHIDRNRFHFDIALNTAKTGFDGERLKELGAEFYFLPLKSHGLKKYCHALYRLLVDKHYDVVHVHENYTSYVALLVAKKAGVSHRIAHAHTASMPYRSIINEIRMMTGRLLNRYFATALIACGQMAGVHVFGKMAMNASKAYVLPNAVDTEVFKYKEDARSTIRKQWNAENDFVIGMVGRICSEKNNLFAIKIFAEYARKNPGCKLIVAGDGDDREEMEKEAKRWNINEKVFFLGRRNDVADIYQGLDALIMPSLYEGFPVAAVEAMASGLPVLLSDKITKELSFGKNVHYLGINDTKQWVDCLLCCNRGTDRSDGLHEIKENGLDINDTAYVLEMIYTFER